jgi:ubiquinone/menaquinone biosynthesis C-methylase UbiE
MDVHHLDFADESFDTLLFIDSIEHVKDAASVIKEVSRVMRPQGNLLLTVANKNSLNQIINRKLGYQSFVSNYHSLYQKIVAMRLFV